MFSDMHHHGIDGLRCGRQNILQVKFGASYRGTPTGDVNAAVKKGGSIRIPPLWQHQSPTRTDAHDLAPWSQGRKVHDKINPYRQVYVGPIPRTD